MAIYNLLKKIIILFCRYLSIGIFFIIFPLIFFVSWLRFIFKKISRQKPSILFSFLGISISYLTARAVATQNYKVKVYSHSLSSPYFKLISWGFNLKNHPFLKRFLYLTDYLPLFIWSIFLFDIYEFNFKGGILMYSKLQKIELFLLKILAKKIVIYGYGSDCKILADVRRQGKYNNALDRDGKSENIDDKIVRGNLIRAKKYADILIAGGDLIHFGQKGVFVPLALDLSLWPPLIARKAKIINIIHATNHRSHKGTRFIIEVIERRKKQKLPINFILIEGKSMSECRKLFKKGDIFITDVITGWHGLSACEAMALGKPVIAYLRKDIFKFHKFYAQNIPVQSANPDTLERVLIELINSYQCRLKLGNLGRQYVEKYHSFDFIGKIYDIIYSKIWQSKKLNQKILEKELKKQRLII